MLIGLQHFPGHAKDRTPLIEIELAFLKLVNLVEKLLGGLLPLRNVEALLQKDAIADLIDDG